mmetsp:Transcript_20707/g.49081  ORF Transcript_20707/g.49081 Transcript_20707/m.49081 type:complete len:288 (-) Transcript_20707:184-1047(-)
MTTGEATDAGSMLSSFIIVFFATALVFLLLRPRDGGRTTQAQNRGESVQGVSSSASRDNTNNSSSPSPKSQRDTCTRTPSHLSAASAALAHSVGANLLVDGLIPFRHTKAAAASSRSDADQAAVNRKERARVLTRLLMEDEGVSPSEATMPPSKGGTLLVAVPVDDAGCSHLSRVLYLLATYYTLMVVVAVDTKFSVQTDRDALLQKLYQGDLTSDILPEHRIVTSSTITGRVAFARQLQRIEMLLEFDAEVRENLSRFGHRVVLYNNSKLPASNSTTVSMLGQKLL